MPRNFAEKFYPRDQAEGLRKLAETTAANERQQPPDIKLRKSPEEEKIKERLAKKEQDLNQSLPKN